MLLPQWANLATPVIGMLHVPPLPGAPRYAGNLSAIRAFVLRDAETLVDSGVHGLMLENFGDAPFFPGTVPAHTVAHLTALAADVKRRFSVPDVPLGINVLRNDGRSGLAIAHAVGAAFIRVNILCGVRVTDQGLIQGIAHDLLRVRTMLGANDVRILADIDVKHSVPLAPMPLENEVRDTIHRGGADALIVTGSGTGQPTDARQLQFVKAVAGRTPVFVGSGVNLDTLDALRPHADGFIIGTAFKRGGQANEPIDGDRVRAFIERLR